MVVCRNSGRYFNVANRSDFYHDFLRSLYEVKPEYPSFYENMSVFLAAFFVFRNMNTAPAFLGGRRS